MTSVLPTIFLHFDADMASVDADEFSGFGKWFIMELLLVLIATALFVALSSTLGVNVGTLLLHSCYTVVTLRSLCFQFVCYFSFSISFSLSAYFFHFHIRL
jgi:hypothetical protein